jgi:HSP20 family protein
MNMSGCNRKVVAGIRRVEMRLIPYRRAEAPARFWNETASLFDDFFSDPFFADKSRDSWIPPVDILEKDGNLFLRVEVPGISEKEIDLKLEGNVLTLKGEKKFENEKDRGNVHRMESYYGSFSRSFTLPDSADRDHIKADFKNGVLTVTVPQKPEVKPREIPVSVS